MPESRKSELWFEFTATPKPDSKWGKPAEWRAFIALTLHQFDPDYFWFEESSCELTVSVPNSRVDALREALRPSCSLSPLYYFRPDVLVETGSGP